MPEEECPSLLKLKAQRTARKVPRQRKKYQNSGIIKFKIGMSRLLTEASLPPQFNSAEVSSWDWAKNGNKLIKLHLSQLKHLKPSLVSQIWKCNYIKYPQWYQRTWVQSECYLCSSHGLFISAASPGSERCFSLPLHERIKEISIQKELERFILVLGHWRALESQCSNYLQGV